MEVNLMSENRAIVAMLRKPREKFWRLRLGELKKLAFAAGYEVLGEVIQIKEAPKAATLFGRGKIEEMTKLMDELKVDTLIVYNVLKSIQKVNLELLTGRRVIDRYDLTLEIFAKNASDAVSKLQIELARIQREIPYVKLLTSLIHIKDRPFIRAGGEYGWKPKIAELRRRMKKLKEEIARYREEKLRQIMERKEKGFKVVCIVGYYNAGKTTLFNALTGCEKPVSDMPFTTLSSKYAKLRGAEKILLVDTIGFVVDLDPRIIKSFEINIDDMRFSDALMLLLDASDPAELFKIKVETSLNILKNVGALVNGKPIVIGLNKVDLVSDRIDIESKKIIAKEIVEKVLKRDPGNIVELSAKERRGLDNLIEKLISVLKV